MKFFQSISISSLSFLLIALPCTFSCKPRPIQPKAVQGVLDLRDWDFNKSNGMIDLDGEWEFYWKVFPNLEENGKWTLPDSKKQWIPVPSQWDDTITTRNEGSIKISENGQGYGTYKLKIILKEPGNFSFRIPNQGTAFRVIINNKVIDSAGIVGDLKSNSEASRKINYQSIQFDTNIIEFIISISNFHHRSGGLWSSIKLGTYQDIEQNRMKQLGLDLFVSGILLIMGIYHFSIYLQRKDDRTSLYFSLVCLSFSLRDLVNGELYINTIISSISYLWITRLDYLTVYACLFFLNEYIRHLYPKDSIKSLCLFFNYSSILFSSLVLIFETDFFSKTLNAFELIILSFLIYIIYILIKSIKHQRKGAKVMLLGFTIFSLITINDILHDLNIIHTGLYSPIGLVCFLFSQAYLISSRFSDDYKKAKYLTHNLELEISERTKKLENTILDLNSTQNELIQEKTQSERIHFMSQEIQKKTNFNDILNSLESILWQSYYISDYLIAVPDFNIRKFRIYSVTEIWKKFSLDQKIRDVSMGQVSFLKNVYERKRSAFFPKLRIAKGGEDEDFNRELLGMESFFAIPCILNNEVFAILSFSDINPIYSKNPNLRPVKNLSLKQRLEIEQLVSLISNSLYQSIQKQTIESAYKEAEQTLNKLKLELQTASNQLIQAEKLSSLGAMVAGIAHEINNPVNFIEMSRFQEKAEMDELKNYLYGLVPEGPEGEAFKKSLDLKFKSLYDLNDQIQTGVKRVVDINHSMRNAARTDLTKTPNVDISDLIRESLLILGGKTKEFIIERVEEPVRGVTCKRSQIGQVIMNLVSNAADALKEKKDRLGSDFLGKIRVGIKNLNHDQIMISVEDNGDGIPVEMRPKVMEAFYTTKPAGVGTGLGLAICGKIISDHKGEISIEQSQDLGGAFFQMILPIDG
jgi:signal transduction histidine kinase